MTDANDDKPQEPAATAAPDSSKSSSSSSWPVFPKLQLPEIPDLKTQVNDFPKRVSEMKIPPHWEEPLESGVVKAVIGATVGGAAGLLLFKSGSGWRSACIAVGVGAAVGNTYERLLKASADAALPK